MSFLGLLNPFCATLLLRGMKLVVAGSSAGTRRWEVPARQLSSAESSSQHPCERLERCGSYGFNSFKNPKQSAAGGKIKKKNQKPRLLLRGMFKDHMN